MREGRACLPCTRIEYNPITRAKLMKRIRIQVDFLTRWLRPMALLPLALAAASLPGFGQQTYVSRFDLFTGYTFLDSPAVSLERTAFTFRPGCGPYLVVARVRLQCFRGHADPEAGHAAARPATGTGRGTRPDWRRPARSRPGTRLSVPAHSRTQTFAARPAVLLSPLQQVPLHPSLGPRDPRYATPRAGNPIAAGVAAQLAPSGYKVDRWSFMALAAASGSNFSTPGSACAGRLRARPSIQRFAGEKPQHGPRVHRAVFQLRRQRRALIAPRALFPAASHFAHQGQQVAVRVAEEPSTGRDRACAPSGAAAGRRRRRGLRAPWSRPNVRHP